MSAYTLVSRQSPDVAALGPVAPPPPATPEVQVALAAMATHPDGDAGPGWKRHLNTLRLLLQPYVYACLLIPWLRLAPLPHVRPPKRAVEQQSTGSSRPLIITCV